MADQAKILETAKAEIESAMNKAFETMGSGDNAAVPEEKPDEKDYVEPIQDPYGKAIKYLEKHNIMQLFQVRAQGNLLN